MSVSVCVQEQANEAVGWLVSWLAGLHTMSLVTDREAKQSVTDDRI